MHIPRVGEMVVCVGEGYGIAVTKGKHYPVIARYSPTGKIYITDDNGDELVIEYPVDTFRLCHFEKSIDAFALTGI